MVELMSKIIRNAPAGRRGGENLIEQKQSFVQLRGERAGEGWVILSYFDKVSFPFWAIFYGLGVNCDLRRVATAIAHLIFTMFKYEQLYSI